MKLRIPRRVKMESSDEEEFSEGSENASLQNNNISDDSSKISMVSVKT